MNVITHPERGQGPAAPWCAQARSLTNWTWNHLVNRTDRYGRYYTAEGTVQSFTSYDLTRDTVLQHFAATSIDHVIGLSSAALDETSLWVAWDIDAHGKLDDDPVRNREFALIVYGSLLDLGLAGRLTDSNGKGGYHIRALFANPQPMAQAFRLGKYLLRDYGSYGFPTPPESFPKSPQLTGRRCGSWLRCPGRHHKRDHWTRVWNGKTGKWKAGDRAVDSLLQWRGVDPDWSAILPADFDGKIKPRSSRVARSRAERAIVPGQGKLARTLRPHNAADVARAASALESLGGDYCDDYDRWVWVGMCLAQLGDEGLALWDAWSSQSVLYDPDEIETKWSTFAPGGPCSTGNTVGLGSLFHEAHSQGWSDLASTIEMDGFRVETRRGGRSGEITFTS